jgi:Pentapeptide repeats (8 copies)
MGIAAMLTLSGIYAPKPSRTGWKQPNELRDGQKGQVLDPTTRGVRMKRTAFLILFLTVCTAMVLGTGTASAYNEADLQKLKKTKQCPGCDLSGAYLSGADLSGARLPRANLSGADLSRADLSGADLSAVKLVLADMTGTNLTGANLTGANLFMADLFGADLFGATLNNADLTGADLTKATWVDGSQWRQGAAGGSK